MAKKQKQVTAQPVKSLKGLELQYQRELMSIGRALAKAVKNEVLPMLKAEQDTYVTDGLATNLAAVFNRLNREFTGTATLSFARQTANKFVSKTEKQNKKRFDKSVKAATGVDLGSILSVENLEEFTEMNIANNVSLIKSLPEEYLKSVETIVTKGVTSGARFSTIEKQITARLGSANSKLSGRIKTIARDQISTINSQISLRRSQALGIEKGIWRTAEDERVRKAHEELNGKEYVLAKGLYSSSAQKHIQPGEEINCRCSFSPVINID